MSFRPVDLNTIGNGITPPIASRLSLEVSVDLHQSGMNGALLRHPRLETTSHALLTKVPFVPTWKPGGLRVATVSVGFPEGVAFLKNED